MAAAGGSARSAVTRTTVLFSPFLALCLLGFGYIVRDAAADGATVGRVTGLVMVGLVALVLGYQVIQSVRDLFAGLTETVGLVDRRWSRNEFLLFRNTYIFVDGNVYRLTPEQGFGVDPGDMVRIVHSPHTSSVETIEVVTRSGASQRPAGG